MCRLSIGTNFHHMKIKMGEKTGLIVAKYLPGTFFFVFVITLFNDAFNNSHQIKVASNY